MAWSRCFRAFWSGLRFTYAVMALICVNMILLGLQVDAGSSPPYEEPGLGLQALKPFKIRGWYDVVNGIIVVFFVLELAVKFAAFGCKGFFCGKDRGWNIFAARIGTLLIIYNDYIYILIYIYK